MDIARHPVIGDSIFHAKEDILKAIEKEQNPSYRNWYAITTAYEDHHLFYILSGTEYRHPMYHRQGSALKLIGLAGSKKEAVDLVCSIVRQFVDSDSLMEIKKSLCDF